MAQHRVRVPEPQGMGQKRTNSEDNLYLAVLRASEGKKGSGYSWLGRAGQAEAGSATSCGRKPGSGRGGVQTEGLNLGSGSETGWGRGQGAVSWPRCLGPVASAHLGQGWPIWQGWQWPLDLGYRAVVGWGLSMPWKRPAAQLGGHNSPIVTVLTSPGSWLGI